MVHIQLYAHIQRESDIGIHSHKYRKTEIHTQRKTDRDTHTPKERHTDIDRIGYLVVLVSNDLVTTRTVGCCKCLCRKNWNRGIYQQNKVAF